MLNNDRPLPLLILLSYLFLSSFLQTAAAQATPLHHVSAKQCASCHQTIYQQWQGSMHANSTALKDPIHGAFYKAVVGDPTQEGLTKQDKYPVCLQCHAPAAAKDGKTDLSALAIYGEGVNCVACHTISAYKGTQKASGGLQLGTQAYEYSSTSLQGPGNSKITADGKHPIYSNTANPAIFKSNAVCMGCHDQRKNANKVTLCQTGSEISASETEGNCLDCHMKKVNGKADHRFLGGHSSEMVSQGLAMSMTHSESSNTLKVSIKLSNKLPHKLPTGAPFRNIYVKLTGYDKQGEIVWASSQSHPVKDDKKAMFMYSLGDAKGNPAPPPKATQVLGDTRLKPYETRELNYAMAKATIVKLKAVAYYDLLLPAMKKKFPQAEHKDLVQPKVIAVSEIELN
ncbi:MAG: cytochrome c family protein [Methyloprofundus sp.]|nr:cytochrome c family protein [Methyloprofundus sp.]